MAQRNHLRATSLALALAALTGLSAAQSPTYYRDIAPLLQRHCQVCHRPGEIGPFPLDSYAEARSHAAAIARATAGRQMPPWFADPHIGTWQNDPSLTAAEIASIQAWARAGAPAGNPRDAPPPPHWTNGWNIDPPDRIVTMPAPVSLPARGQVDYTYEIVPSGFTHDTWVREIEIRPSARAHVHHAVVYIRPPSSSWLRAAPVGRPFTAASLTDAAARQQAEWTDSDILLVYAPGSAPARWPQDLGKLVPAGSDFVFQMHYTTNGTAATDRTSMGLVFNRQPPPRRVLTLQITDDSFLIPPGDADYRTQAHGTLPNAATLLSIFPHMHLRGKRFEFNIVHADGTIEPLLRVNWNFYWQRTYVLAHPRALPAGTDLQVVGWFDNSAGNPHNPDPTVAVRWGDQTTDEMLVGFFDVAVPAAIDKQHFFIRHH